MDEKVLSTANGNNRAERFVGHNTSQGPQLQNSDFPLFSQSMPKRAKFMLRLRQPRRQQERPSTTYDLTYLHLQFLLLLQIS
jgi:hypothetical protein